ncbi:MAG: hypothetical protein ABW173_10090 [Sphingomonas sp.]
MILARRSAPARALPLALLSTLAACAGTSPPQRPSHVPAVPAATLGAGLERVMGKDARTLQILFGAPDLDVREGPARKLQYASAVCVLDAYLYPTAAGRDAVVRYVDARLPTGDDFDRASCVAALSRRAEAR